jgi:pre-mRNA-splicing factor SYF2
MRVRVRVWDVGAQEGVDRLVAELSAQQERRNNFSRRRAVNPDATVDYINERNRNFNKKLSRSFDKYTVEIRQNLERGTAL